MEFNVYTFLVVLAVISVAVTTDLRTRRIPNWLTIPSFAAGILYHVITGGWTGLLFALGGFATGFGFLLILWLIGGGGGGDVKLMGAIGAWLGAPMTLVVFIGSAIFSLVCTVAIVVWYRNTSTQVGGSANGDLNAVKTNSTALKQTIPYALPVSMTLVAVFLFFLVSQ